MILRSECMIARKTVCDATGDAAASPQTASSGRKKRRMAVTRDSPDHTRYQRDRSYQSISDGFDEGGAGDGIEPPPNHRNGGNGLLLTFSHNGRVRPMLENRVFLALSTVRYARGRSR